MAAEYSPVRIPMRVSADQETIPMTVGTDEVSIPMRIGVEIRSPSIDAGGLPEGGSFGDILIKQSDTNYDAAWLPPADSPEQDNTRPITAAAVYTTVGNINALLATI